MSAYLTLPEVLATFADPPELGRLHDGHVTVPGWRWVGLNAAFDDVYEPIDA